MSKSCWKNSGVSIWLFWIWIWIQPSHFEYEGECHSDVLPQLSLITHYPIKAKEVQDKQWAISVLWKQNSPDMDAPILFAMKDARHKKRQAGFSSFFMCHTKVASKRRKEQGTSNTMLSSFSLCPNTALSFHTNLITKSKQQKQHKKNKLR